MHIISYVSDSVIEAEQRGQEITKIVDVAQKYNFVNGITGVLFFEGDQFFQTIEGNEYDLRALYSIIERDPRHRNLKKLIDQPIGKRAFAGWSLDTFYIDHQELINPKSIQSLLTLYHHNFDIDTVQLIKFVKKMIDEMDNFKILTTPYMQR